MAWSSSTINGLNVITEDVTINGASSGTTSSTSTYITTRKPFTVSVNTANTNVDFEISADVWGSYDGTTFHQLTFGGFLYTLDSAGKSAVYHPDQSGWLPYYRIRIYTAGSNLTSDTVTVKIVY